MGVYLRAKFEVSSIILTNCRQWEVILPPSLTSKRTPKKPTQIRVKGIQTIDSFSYKGAISHIFGPR